MWKKKLVATITNHRIWGSKENSQFDGVNIIVFMEHMEKGENECWIFSVQRNFVYVGQMFVRACIGEALLQWKDH